METDNKELIIKKFREIKDKGWIESHRKNNTGIGKTFEDLIGVEENNLNEPDLAGFEIKSHRDDVNNYITLFTKAPNFPKSANTFLRDNFGTPYDDNPDIKKLHTSIFADKKNTYGDKYSFKLINDSNSKQIRIGVYDQKTQEKIDSSVGYNYDCIEKALKNKLNNLFYVSAQRRVENSKEEFYYDKAEIYTKPSLENFLNLLDNGDIMYDIRIGTYKDGAKKGKTHDHGSGFRILEKNLEKLYSNKEVAQ